MGIGVCMYHINGKWPVKVVQRNKTVSTLAPPNLQRALENIPKMQFINAKHLREKESTT